MTMDYGPPIDNMGQAAISAAKGVHQQLVQVGGHVPLIGITPMIGENDVPGEVFSLQNARDVTEFARNDPTIAWIGYWSISRDTDQWGPLYASSQISQNKYDFARSFSGLASDYSVKLVDDHPSLKYPQPAEKYGIEVAKRLPEKVSANKKPEEKKAEEKYYNFSKYADYHGKLAVRRGQEKIVYANQNSPPSRKVELNSKLFSPPLTTGRIFSPYVDVSLKPEFDTLDAHVRVSLSKFTFGFIIAGKKKAATWGGKIAIDSQHIIEEIAEVRKNHGDVIFSFGGLKGVELALAIKNIDELVKLYQSIITLHSITWIDFFINDSALEDVDSVQRRNEAIARLQKDNLNLKVSYSLHTFPTGLSQNGLNLLQSAVDAGAQIDRMHNLSNHIVVNILAMNYGKTNAPNGGVAAGAYAIQAASSVSSQLDILKLNSSIGITPMIGQNHVTSEYFTLADAQQVISWAHTKDWVQFVSIFSANRDTKDLIIDANNGTAGGLNLQFCKVFSGFEH
ncbi:hypothetical protein HDV02_002492 [Globomyces sp. JEL0801]|nr:hypothetical protein HDV02_002492 [Globomyces sp. JEL0801]